MLFVSIYSLPLRYHSLTQTNFAIAVTKASNYYPWAPGYFWPFAMYLYQLINQSRPHPQNYGHPRTKGFYGCLLWGRINCRILSSVAWVWILRNHGAWRRWRGVGSPLSFGMNLTEFLCNFVYVFVYYLCVCALYSQSCECCWSCRIKGSCSAPLIVWYARLSWQLKAYQNQSSSFGVVWLIFGAYQSFVMSLYVYCLGKCSSGRPETLDSQP